MKRMWNFEEKIQSDRLMSSGSALYGGYIRNVSKKSECTLRKEIVTGNKVVIEAVV